MKKLIPIVVITMLAVNVKASGPEMLTLSFSNKERINELVQVNMEMIRSYQNYQLTTSSVITWGVFLSSISLNRFDEFIKIYREYNSEKDNLDALYAEFHSDELNESEATLVEERYYSEKRVKLLPQY